MANKVRDLRRQRFGKLVAIKRNYHIEDKQSYWLCLCKCGNEKEVTRKHLLDGSTTSCGCVKSELTSKRSWKGHGDISGSYWYDIIRNAKYRNISFDITIEEAWQKFLEQNRKCALTGDELVFYTRRKKDANIQTASLDRIDNTKGYTKNNCYWLHKSINRLKSDFTVEELLNLARKLVKYNGEENYRTRR